MGRFTAYTSDISDDEDDDIHISSDDRPPSQPPPEAEEEEVSDSESSSSTSSDEMHEDELTRSPPRKAKTTRNALVQDEDGEIRYSHEVDGSHGRPMSSSPPLMREEPIPWAQQVGVDPQRMHVMQASLFRVPEEAEAMRAANKPKRSAWVLPQSLNRKHSRGSDGGGLRAEPRERSSFAQNIETIPYRPTRKYARVESSASAVDGNERAMVDAGLALGRSFRVGWGPSGSLVHLGELCGPFTPFKTSANSSVVSLTRVPTFPTRSEGDVAHITKLLQYHLSNSPIEPDEDGIPFANPSSTLRFSSFASLFPPNDRSFEASLLRLGHALFDEIDYRLGESITIDVQKRVAELRRKAEVSAWLEDAVAPAVDADLKKNPTADSAGVAFTLLTGNQVQKASETAMDGRNFKLATLISQASGDLEFKADLRDQLQVWRDQRIDVHINENIRKIYGLLGGITEVVEGSKGTGLDKCPDLVISKGLDWKRTFGLYLWFAEAGETPLAAVFQTYDQARKDSAALIASPLPSYSDLSPHAAKSLTWKLPPLTRLPPDASFSLIKLFSDPVCSLSTILTPYSFGPSPVDYSLPWHLYIILSRCMRIRDFADRGDPGIEVDASAEEGYRVEGHSPSADLLASTYALQLEQLGMIQEALFVLLHIEGSAGREKAIKDLLSRSAPKLDAWTTRGIVGSLKIPISWVNEVKAIYALDNGEVFEAYELYLTAGLYNAAHEIAVLELAPDAVNRRDLELLDTLFSRFAGHPVDGWNTRGKVFLDYVHIMTRLRELNALLLEHNSLPDLAQVSELEELARSVPKLIGILPDVLRNHSNPRHNAALVEMISGMMKQLDLLRPLALSQSQVQPALVGGPERLHHIHSTAYERFMKTIEVA